MPKEFKFVLTLALLFIFESAFAKKLSLRISDYSTVQMGMVIKLGDLLVAETTAQHLEDEIFDVAVSEAINSEVDKELSSQAIAQLLRQSLSIQVLQKYSLIFPEKIVVRAKRNFISDLSLKRDLIKHAQLFCRTCSIEVEDLHIPEIKISDEVLTSSLNFDNFRNPGSFLIPLNLETSKGKVQKFVTGRISLFKEVLVANRLLQIGTRVSASDFDFRSINLNFAKDAVAVQKDIEGKVMARTLPLGQPIFLSDLKPELAAIRGQTVKVIIANDKFEVSSSGIAEQDGIIGEVIKFKHAISNKIMSGILIDKAVVRVD